MRHHDRDPPSVKLGWTAWADSGSRRTGPSGRALQGRLAIEFPTDVRETASTERVTDLELVERAKQGDANAFGELVDRHHRAALRAAMAALRSPQDADDAVQEAWIAARDRLEGFRAEAEFRTWLLTIVWNKARDRRRSLMRWMMRLASFDDTDAQGVTALELSGPRQSSSDALLGAELRDGVRRLVASLPKRLRDPLLLVASGEYTYEEVAAMLGQPVGTIKWRVSDARRQLRVKLERLGFGQR